jgi:hypothetical protein
MVLADHIGIILQLTKLLTLNGNSKIFKETIKSLNSEEYEILKQMKRVFTKSKFDNTNKKIRKVDGIVSNLLDTRADSSQSTVIPSDDQLVELVDDATLSDQTLIVEPSVICPVTVQIFDNDDDEDDYDEPPNTLIYDRSDVYPTLRDKIPRELYTRLNTISKLFLSSHQNLADAPTLELEVLCKKIFIKNHEILEDVYDHFHRHLQDNVATDSDDDVERDLCHKLNKPYRRLTSRVKPCRK